MEDVRMVRGYIAELQRMKMFCQKEQEGNEPDLATFLK